jgi:trans-aconitate methyltransferase
MRSDAERERLRETFDQAAEIYHRVRPDYPEALFDDLNVLAGLAPGDRLLEVGCATGKATLPLARRGFSITCLELGSELAAVARRNLAGFDVEVIAGRFEDWPPGEPVSLVFAATAWHWIDPRVRYQRAWEALRPGGHLALWAQGHVFPDGAIRSSRRSRRSTTRSARGCRRTRSAPGRENSKTTGPGSRPAGCSK